MSEPLIFAVLWLAASIAAGPLIGAWLKRCAQPIDDAPHSLAEGHITAIDRNQAHRSAN